VLLEAVALAAATEATKTLGFAHHGASAADIQALAPNSDLSIVRYAPEPKINLKSAEIPGRSGESNYGLPVAQKGEDIRAVGFVDPEIHNDPSLHTLPGIAIDKIGLYYDDPENKEPERNRLKVFVANALWRAYEIAQTMINPETGEIDRGKAMAFAQSGKVPQDPNWENCVVRQQSGESLILPLMALPEGADPIVDALEPYNFNILDGVILNYTAEHKGMFHQMPKESASGDYTDGWAFRRAGNQLQIDIFTDNSGYIYPEDPPELVQLVYDISTMHTTIVAFQSLLTLGIFERQGEEAYSLFGRFFARSFSEKMAENYHMSIFQEQVALMLGEITPEAFEAGWPDRLMKTKLLQ
jgi:hypothetical protein